MDDANDRPAILEGMAALVDRYDAFLCDLWGAVHDGVRPYPDAPDCLERLRLAGRPVILLSNAPRPAASVAERLDAMGVFAGRHYDSILTSGDATAAALNEPPDADHAALGRRFWHLGPGRDAGLVAALRGRETVEPAAAEFILASGLMDDDTETPDHYRDAFAAAIGRGLTLVCANPDIVVVRGTDLVWCAGALARLYEEMGGRVLRHGKPYRGVFDLALARLGGVARGRVAMLGDGPETDLAGAEAAGLDAVWIAGGIHADDVGCPPGGPLDPAATRAFLQARGRRPVAAVAALRW